MVRFASCLAPSSHPWISYRPAHPCAGVRRREMRFNASRESFRLTPALLVAPGVAQTARPCTAEQSRRSIAATLRAFSRRACDARHRERRRFSTDAVHPWTASSQPVGKARCCFCLALRFCCCGTMPPKGAPVARRGREGKVRRRARTMRARSLHAHGCAFSEPRSGLGHSEHTDVRRARHRGVFLLVTFLCTSTAPQERREQRSWRQRRGGQDARSQEKLTARP